MGFPRVHNNPEQGLGFLFFWFQFGQLYVPPCCCPFPSSVGSGTPTLFCICVLLISGISSSFLARQPLTGPFAGIHAPMTADCSGLSVSSVAVALCLHLCCMYVNAVPLLYVVIPELCLLVGVGRPCNSDCRSTWSHSSPPFVLNWHPVGPVGFPAPLGRYSIAFYAALLFVVGNCRYVIFFPSAFVDSLPRLSGSSIGTPSPFLCPSVSPGRIWTSIFANLPRRIAPLPFSPPFFITRCYGPCV